MTGGEITGARRLEPPGNVRWEIQVRPDSDSTVTIVLPVTTDCAADGGRLHRGRQDAVQPAGGHSSRTGRVGLVVGP